MSAITPQDALERAGDCIPEYIIDAVNELLLENLDYHEGKPIHLAATIRQHDLVNRILIQNPSLTKQQLYDNHWLNFEPVFRRAGWDVVYDRPAYNETYEPTFRFTSILVTERGGPNDQ